MKKTVYLAFALLIMLNGCTPNVNEDSTEASISTEAPTVFTPTHIETTETVDEVVFDPMELVKDMTDEELVGQLFLVRYPGNDRAKEDIARYHLGGFVLFGNDFKEDTPDSITSKIASLQENASVPLLFAVDEEGGTVTRVSRYAQFRSKNFSSPRKLYNNGGMEAIIETENEKCQLLKSLGINVNLGPVCDITQNRSSFMYDRSLGQGPEITADFTVTVVDIMDSHQLGSVLKHFPGYGDNTDTHNGIAIDNRSLTELEMVDLVPFQAGINAGCDSIMISHTYIMAIDSQMPASLSKNVTQYLRNEMGFQGVIMTDDLAMNAISDQFGPAEAAVLAIDAGVDMLCCTEYPEHYNAVLAALQNGRISRDQLEKSVSRIILWKYKLGIL